MFAKWMTLVVFGGLLLGTGSQAALIGNSLRALRTASEQPNSTLQLVTTVTDTGFLVEDLRALSGCSTSTGCRWTGRAVSWWTYDNSGVSLDTTNVLAPGSTTRIARDAQNFFADAPPATGVFSLGHHL